jgi:hypothetical protein
LTANATTPRVCQSLSRAVRVGNAGAWRARRDQRLLAGCYCGDRRARPRAAR